MPFEENKILIVDDQRANRLVLEQILKPLNLLIYQASSGREALEQIESHDFAVILMDVLMPDLDGYEVTRLIRKTQRLRKLPIVMVTSLDTREQYLKAYEAGAVDLVTKPVEPIVLISKVTQFVELHNQRLRAQRSRIEQERLTSRMQILLNSAGEGILGIDRSGMITFANPKACQLLKVERHSLILRSIQEFLKLERPPEIYEAYTFESRTGERQINMVTVLMDRENKLMDRSVWHRDDDTEFYVEYNCEITRDLTGNNSGGVVTFQDVTERKLIEEKLVRLANYDPLTNLANRAYFHDTLVRTIAQSKRRNSKLALLLLDLDHFKEINDTMGHDVGDLLLQEVSHRLTHCIRATDLAARLGGDEFAVILYDVTNLAGIVKIAQKITQEINRPMELQNKQIHVSASMGIAVFHNEDMTLEELVKAADIAMYVAKKEGRNTFQFFEPEMQQKAKERNQLQFSLTQAVKQNQLSIHYQPKISTKEEKVVGFEALLRWKSEDGKSFEPDVFIPVAEESGLIHELGEWVVKTVCQQIHLWQAIPGFSELTVSMNVSSIQLKTGTFHSILASAIDEFHIKPQQIGIELTENTVMTQPDLVIKELQVIQQLGVSILVDDFGTGSSSLNYLRRFPIDVLKIDQSFVRNIGVDRHDEEIIKLIIAMAHTLNIQVIAEGVETSKQLGFISAIGCDLVQGHYFSEPLSPLAVERLLSEIDQCYSAQFDQFHSYLEDKTQDAQHSLMY